MSQQSQKNCKVMVTTGHSGGHIMPALAIAEALRAKGCDVVWLGRRGAMEARLVPEHNIPIHLIEANPLRGSGLLAWLALPFRLTRSVWQAWRVIRHQKPDVVLAGGGYVSVPGGIVAWLSRIPLVLHEQNTVPGMANRLLVRFAKSVCEAFPNSFGNHKKLQNKTILVGNPIRDELINMAPPQARFDARSDAPRLLITGGSQGAAVLNETVPQALVSLAAQGLAPVQVWHQAGEKQVQVTRQRYNALELELGDTSKISAFIDDMAAAWAWADLVICRAGAMTVSELAAVGLPAIFIPLPPAISDNQTTNAKFLVDAGAARMISQANLTPEVLANALKDLLFDRRQLTTMAIRANALAKTDGASAVAEICLRYCKEQKTATEVLA